MFWIQSGISGRVSPNFYRGAQKVSRSNSPYKTLSSIEFPAEFTGKEAVATTLKSLDACYKGANALPGLLAGIGHGMTLKDNASFADLLNLFKTTQQDLKKADVSATLFQYTGKEPTADEIQKILSSQLSRNGYGYGWGYADENAAQMANQRAGIIWSGLTELGKEILNTGAELVTGFVSGAFGFVGDALGAGFTCGALLLNRPDLAYRLSKGFDWGGQVDDMAKLAGIDTGSTAYTIGRAGGKIVTNCAIYAAAPELIPYSTTINAGIYGLQSYNQSYRGAIEDYMRSSGKVDVKSAWNWNEIQEVQKNITPEMGMYASLNATAHSLGTFATSLWTGYLTKDPSTTLSTKLGGNFTVHAVGATYHKVTDILSKRKEKWNWVDDTVEVLATGAFAATATVLANPESKSKLNSPRKIEILANKIQNTTGKLVDNLKSRFEDTPMSNVANIVINKVADMANDVVEDAEGGSHSYSIEVAHRIMNSQPVQAIQEGVTDFIDNITGSSKKSNKKSTD